MAKYLDSVGLTYLWDKITSIFAKKEDISQYIVCTLAEYSGLESYDNNTFYIIESADDARDVIKIMKGSKLMWPLPYDAEVEWIYMPYGSYLNTGIAGLNLASFDIECVVKADGYPTEASSFFGVYGQLTSGKQAGGAMVRQYPEGTVNGVILNYEASGNQSRSATLPSDFMTVRLTSTAFYLNGSRVGNTYSAYNVSLPNNQSLSIYINARKDYRNTNSGLVDEVWCQCAAWYKKFTFIHNGVTVRDYIPVRKNGVGYLYDKVSGELFGNDGSGIFGIGSDK